jgi:integrase
MDMDKDLAAKPGDGYGTEEDWVAPFRRALELHGRAADKHKWHIAWARKFAKRMGAGGVRGATREDVDAFLAMLSTSSGIAPWQTDQAAASLRILIGSVFGQEWARVVRAPLPPPPRDIPVPDGDDPVGRLRYSLRCRNYSMRTEKSYAFWVERFRAFCREGGVDMEADAVRAFLERLVISSDVSAATQAQALNALSFFFQAVLQRPFGNLGEFRKSRRPKKLPVVLSREEVRRLLDALDVAHRLPAALLYRSGLRLLEALELRVKDIDFDRRQIQVHDGKGRKDRITVLPDRWRDRLAAHISAVRKTYEGDLAAGYAGATFGPGLERKYPNAPRAWSRQPGGRDATISTRPRSSARSRRRPSVSGSPSRWAATRSATASPHTCWSRERTSAPCRSCWATATSRRRWSTPTSSTARGFRFEAPRMRRRRKPGGVRVIVSSSSYPGGGHAF